MPFICINLNSPFEKAVVSLFLFSYQTFTKESLKCTDISKDLFLISVHCCYRFSDFPLITKLILHYYIIGNDVFVKIVREVGAIGMN